jgi:hypothetical protein
VEGCKAEQHVHYRSIGNRLLERVEDGFVAEAEKIIRPFEDVETRTRVAVRARVHITGIVTPL